MCKPTINVGKQEVDAEQEKVHVISQSVLTSSTNSPKTSI